MSYLRASVLSLFTVVCLACGGTSRLGSGTTGGPPPPPLPTFTAIELNYPGQWITGVNDDGRVFITNSGLIRDGAPLSLPAPPGASSLITFTHVTPDGEVAFAGYSKTSPKRVHVAYSPVFGDVEFFESDYDFQTIRKVEPDGTIWIELSKRYVYDPNGIRWKYPGPVEYVGYSGLPPRIEFDGTPDPPPGYDAITLTRASPDRQWAIGRARPLEGGWQVHFLVAPDGLCTPFPDDFHASYVADGGNMVLGSGDSVEGMHNSPGRIWLRDRGIVSLEDAMAEAGFPNIANPNYFMRITGVSPSKRLYIVEKGDGSPRPQWLLTINPSG